MPRLITLLLVLALALTNGPAVASAICQHGGAGAHAEALHSGDSRISASAQAEERAAEAAQKVALSDGASAMIAGFMLPPDSPVLTLPSPSQARHHRCDPSGLATRSLRPLLEPPLF